MKRLAGVAAVAVALVAVGGAASADAPTRTITIPAKLFDPDRLDVLVGTTVTWKNDDHVNHTATAENDAFASGYIPPGGTFSFAFTKEGKVRVPLHDPPADARRGGRIRPRALGA